MKWFKDWFNSDYYHILYKNRNDKEAKAFIDNLIENLNLTRNSKLIDIGCGKGRHATYFNKKGMNVVGIDLATNSIKEAKKNTNTTLQFKVHDMREVFKENHFDIATNLFTSFGYFENQNDNIKTLNAIANNLKKDGVLIIDFMNVYKVIHNLVNQEKKIINNITFKIKRRIEKKTVIKEILIKDQDIKKEFKEKVDLLTLEDFSKLIQKAGLELINIFGNYKLEKFDKKRSERLILIVKK